MCGRPSRHPWRTETALDTPPRLPLRSARDIIQHLYSLGSQTAISKNFTPKITQRTQLAEPGRTHITGVGASWYLVSQWLTLLLWMGCVPHSLSTTAHICSLLCEEQCQIYFYILPSAGHSVAQDLLVYVNLEGRGSRRRRFTSLSPSIFTQASNHLQHCGR